MSQVRDRVRCAHCTGPNPRKHSKVDRGFRTQYALICAPCGRRGGWWPVTYDRVAISNQQSAA